MFPTELFFCFFGFFVFFLTATPSRRDFPIRGCVHLSVRLSHTNWNSEKGDFCLHHHGPSPDINLWGTIQRLEREQIARTFLLSIRRKTASQFVFFFLFFLVRKVHKLNSVVWQVFYYSVSFHNKRKSIHFIITVRTRATLYCGPEKPRIQKKVLGHSLVVRSFAHTAHSFTCSFLLILLTRSPALTRLLARSLCSLPRSWESEWLDGYSSFRTKTTKTEDRFSTS